MKKLLTIIFVLYIGIMSVTQSVEAHILKTDRSIGAVLHIAPEDEPIVGEPAYFFFEFKDKTNKFQPAQCDCTVSIISQGKILYSQPLFQNNTDPSLTSSTFSYTFSEKNIYAVEILGKPIQPDAFQSFHLMYDIRVDRASTQTTASSKNTDDNSHLYHSVLFFIVFAVLIIGNTIFALRKKHRSKANHTKTLILIIIPAYAFIIMAHVLHTSHTVHAGIKASAYSCCTLAVAEVAHNFTLSVKYNHAVMFQNAEPAPIFIVLTLPFHNRSPTA